MAVINTYINYIHVLYVENFICIYNVIKESEKAINWNLVSTTMIINNLSLFSKLILFMEFEAMILHILLAQITPKVYPQYNR